MYDDFWECPSDSQDYPHTVDVVEMVCTCDDFYYTNKPCKHIKKVLAHIEKETNESKRHNKQP